MTNEHDRVELDPSNEEFNKALDFIKHTNKLVYLTGKAGTGKTTFLKHLKSITQKNVVVLAPTGVAAVNAGGETIHSFFQIPPSLYVPDDPRLRDRPTEGDPDRSTIYDHFKFRKEKAQAIRALDLLVIDEVSMVRCDLIDVVDRLLRVFRNKRDLPFGGVQTLLIGDAFQLPPVVKPEDWNILGRFYKSPFFFGSKVLEANKPIYIELKKIYRQREEEFISLLNRVRVSEVGQQEMLALNERLDPSFEPESDKGYIILGTHNAQVESVNEAKLRALNTPPYEFEAVVEGVFPERIYPTDRTLCLKVGAQVMFLKNALGSGVFNGSIGRVSKLDDSHIEVTLPNENVKIVDKHTWRNIRYTWDEKAGRIREELLGTFTQYPLRLAWAITVHKSQGLTFERVIADLGSAFASGQVYVALSRCTSFNGLVLKSRIDRSAIKTDPDVLLFAKQETPDTLIVEELNSGKADGFYQTARIAFRAGRVEEAYAAFLSALKHRNDIGENLLRRYFNVHGSRLAQWPNRYVDVASRLDDSQGQVLLLSHALRDQLEVNEEQNKDLNEISRQKSELQNKLTHATDVVVAKEEDLQEQQNHIVLLNSRVKMLNDGMMALKSEVADKEKVVGSSSKRVAELEQEVNRLKELSWWDKLWEKI